MELAVLAPFFLKRFGVFGAALLELGGHVGVGGQKLEVARPGVQRQVLLGHVEGLLLHVFLELVGRDALLHEVRVEAHVLALQLLEEVLQQAGLGVLGHGLRHLAFQALGQHGQAGVLLHAGQHVGLLLRDGLGDARAQVLHVFEAQRVLGPFVGDLGQLLGLAGLHFHVEGDLRGLAGQLRKERGRLGRHVDDERLRLALLHGHELLVERLGEQPRSQAVDARLGGKALDGLAGVVGGLDGQVGKAAFLDLRGRARVLEGVVVLAQAFDLFVHLGVGRAFRRKLHLDGLVAGKL